jgi:sterol desaturase/sphingolipid hydroxylase (fatty acid hydroxylase superfamily)
LAYGSHRAMHEVPWLWRFHAVHHAPRELDWLKAWRQHPVDVAIHAWCVGLPGVLLGAPLSGLASLVLLRRLWTALLHANVRLKLGPLEHVIVSPEFHQTHHAGSVVNYAGLFPWLDRLFGTSAPRAMQLTGSPVRGAEERYRSGPADERRERP